MLGFEGVAGQVRELPQQGRLVAGEAVGVGEHLRPEPDRHGQRCGAEIDRLAGVEADAVGAMGLDLTDGLALHQLGDRGRPARQQNLQIRAMRGGQVERHVEDMALRRRADAGLLGVAVEGIRPREIDHDPRARRTWPAAARAWHGRTDRARGRSEEQAAARKAIVLGRLSGSMSSCSSPWPLLLFPRSWTGAPGAPGWPC